MTVHKERERAGEKDFLSLIAKKQKEGRKNSNERCEGRTGSKITYIGLMCIGVCISFKAG